ncbi:EF-hand domain-containing protein [Methylobacillus gramineus]|uniref:EF-hand domain-containing protein n=1 Tax=Methylobacillus gramineus TaxID=755169 RepID=UPI001CFF62FB|nr:EF-hand domain-containing protein [Methylobacillus gramineus]MCB5184588.1 EF-hand domain-containing protein [Methylobacillus gramineus]
MISSINGNASQIASSIFSKIDTNNKGYIEQADLQTAFNGIDSSDSDSSVNELFSALDSDSDDKLTESELTDGVTNLLSQLNSQFDNARVQGGMPPLPPPQNEGEEDEGYTQNELESIASSTSDSKLSSLMSNVAANFEAADTNEDGKVSAKEAMAYEQSQQQQGNASQAQSEQARAGNKISLQISQLISTYGNTEQSSSSSLSLAA